MKKIEIIWRHLLTSALEEKKFFFQQKELAEKFGFSLSTISHALQKLRKIGAIEVGGKGFKLVDFEKLLFFWATRRNLQKEIIYQTFSPLPVLGIEASMPPSVIPTAFSAYRFLFSETPADYDRVFFYTDTEAEVSKRFPKNTSRNANIFILKKDAYLEKYKSVPPLPQIFVDLWNIPTWYAKEYQQALLQKMREKFGR